MRHWKEMGKHINKSLRYLASFNLNERIALIEQEIICFSFIITKVMKPTNPPNQALNKLKQICSETQKFQKKIVGKDFLLGKYFDAQKTKLISKKEKKYTKSKIQKLLNIQEKLSSKDRTYQFYQPLHQLWKDYTTDLLKNDKHQDAICLKLLRADYHGAEMTVISSGIQSYIGLTGIIINQSLKTFKIITKENRILMLLKNEIVFQVSIKDKHYAVNGNCLIFRATDRAKHKFKSRKAEKLNLSFMDDFLEE